MMKHARNDGLSWVHNVIAYTLAGGIAGIALMLAAIFFCLIVAVAQHIWSWM